MLSNFKIFIILASRDAFKIQELKNFKMYNNDIFYTNLCLPLLLNYSIKQEIILLVAVHVEDPGADVIDNVHGSHHLHRDDNGIGI